MTAPLTPEALVDQIARCIDVTAHNLGRADYYGPDLVLAFASARVSTARKTAAAILAGPLAPLLAALQHVTAERDAEYHRANKAIIREGTASAEAARLRAEVEALKGALKQIADACPVTCDMSVAHDMAATAEHALARAATAREG